MCLKRIFRAVGLAAAVIFTTQAVSATFEPIYVEGPFDTDKKLENFLRRFKDKLGIGDDFIPNAKLIRRFGYEFEPFPCYADKTCGDKKTAGYVYKIIEIDQSSTEAEVAAAVATLRYDDCSFFGPSGLYRDAVLDNLAIYHVDIGGKIRICGGILGKHDIGSIEGVVRVFVNLDRFEVKLKDKLAPVRFRPTHSYDVDGEILGFINIDSLFGKLFIAAIGFTINPTLGLISNFLIKTPDLDLPQAAEAVAGFVEAYQASLSSLSDFLAKAETIKLVTQLYVSVPDRTRLQVSGGQLQLRIVSRAAVSQVLYEYYHSVKVDEIKILNSLGDDPEIYLAQPGDSLWTIAGRKYDHPEFYHLILLWNQQLHNRLRPSDSITLLPIFEAYGGQDDMILPGESLWVRWKSDSKGLSWSEYRKTMKPRRSPSPDRIFPLQTLRH